MTVKELYSQFMTKVEATGENIYRALSGPGDTPPDGGVQDNPSDPSKVPGLTVGETGSPDDQSFDPMQERLLNQNTHITADQQPQGSWGQFDKELYGRYEQLLRNSPYLHQNQNLANGDPALNVNGKDLAETRRLSRLADMMNNRVYLTPGKASSVRTLEGGATSGYDSDMPTIYQMPKIATEETRQMDRMREYERQVRNRMIGRQQNALDLPLEMQRERMMEELRRSGLLHGEELRRLEEQYNMNLHRERMAIDDDYQRRYYTFQRNLDGLHLPIAQARWLLTNYPTNSTMMNLAAQLMGALTGLPSPLKQNIDNRIAAILSDKTLTAEEQTAAILELHGYIAEQGLVTGIDVGGDVVRSTMDAAGNEISGGGQQ